MPDTSFAPSAQSRLSVPVQGALWMLLAAALFSVLNALIRQLSAELHPFQVVFFRNLFGLVFMLPWLLWAGRGMLRTTRLRGHIVRALTGLGAMLSWFYGVSVLPLGEAVALSFTAPLFATIGAALFLGETVRLRRWSATVAGFLGVLVILRPGAEAISTPALIVLLSAAISAASALQVKSLSRTEPAAAVVTYMVLFLTPMSLVPALFVWQMPSAEALGWAVLMGAVASLGHLCLTRALQLADASAVMPFDYAKLPVSALIGYLLYDEVLDAWTWVGAGIICAATIYIAHREAVVARRARAALSVVGGPPGPAATGTGGAP